MTKITDEQKKIMHELLDFAIECKEVGFNLWFNYVPHVNWIELRHYQGKTHIAEHDKSDFFYFEDLTQETLTQIKHEVLAIINQVDI